MEKHTYPWYVLTGGPCAGKTTLIREFEADGLRVVHESARTIIEQGLEAGKTLEEIRTPPQEFTEAIVARDIANLGLHPNHERVFFDRSVIDNVAYHRLFGLTLSPVLEEALDRARFRKMFLLDIVDYQTDEARNESPEEARRIHEALYEAYRDYGIMVERVPVLPVAERVAYIVERL